MIKVLIVDDEKPICDLIDLNLSASGYHCTSVQDGAEALRYCLISCCREWMATIS